MILLNYINYSYLVNHPNTVIVSLIKTNNYQKKRKGQMVKMERGFPIVNLSF